MLRMETNNTDTNINLSAVMEYETGVSNTEGTVDSTFDEILANSSINIFTKGGNGEVASSAIDAANIDSGAGSLNYIITGENAVYCAINAGAPITYTIRYLNDNSIAKMGYIIDYTL